MVVEVLKFTFKDVVTLSCNVNKATFHFSLHDLSLAVDVSCLCNNQVNSLLRWVFTLKHSLQLSDDRGLYFKPIHIHNSTCHILPRTEIMLFFQLVSRTAALVWWCLNVSMWQQAGVTVINPFPLQACHLHNKATIPDAKASPHIYCYNYLTFKSTLMSPRWSHSLSSFGFRALLLSNKVTFHNTAISLKYTSPS